MIYNEKIQGLLEALDGKLKILTNVINGAQQITPSQAIEVLEDSRKLVERVAELNRINR